MRKDKIYLNPDARMKVSIILTENFTTNSTLIAHGHQFHKFITIAYHTQTNRKFQVKRQNLLLIVLFVEQYNYVEGTNSLIDHIHEHFTYMLMIFIYLFKFFVKFTLDFVRKGIDMGVRFCYHDPALYLYLLYLTQKANNSVNN